MNGFWAFWQISGWYGKWSKYHLFYKEGSYPVTACGRWAQPDDYVPIRDTGANPRIGDRCKICQKIYQKAQEKRKND